MLNQIKTTQPMERAWLSAPIIRINEDVTSEKQAHYWYGGEMATIEVAGYKFHIEAIGDVYAELFKSTPLVDEDLSWDDLIETIKDKGNQGVFGEVIGHYIKDDEELMALINDNHPEYRLNLDYANWWECFVTDPQGDWHDLMWDLDSTSLNDAIAEVLEALQEGLEIGEIILQFNPQAR